MSYPLTTIEELKERLLIVCENQLRTCGHGEFGMPEVSCGECTQSKDTIIELKMKRRTL